MLSPNIWHKMIFSVTVALCAASNRHKQPKWGSVTYWVLWYLFLVTCLDQSWSAHFHRVISSISPWQNVLFHQA
jgi:apolipoprotein N-acyltransferase